MWKKYRVSILVFIFLNFGCSKSSTTEAPPLFTPGVDVYMAGELNSKAVYWRNGEVVELAPNATAYAIQVVGSDIFVGGYVYDTNFRPHAAYWKNGVQVILEGSGISQVLGLCVDGGDIYCVGDFQNPPNTIGDTAVYWKNNNPRINLSMNSYARASAVSIVGSAIYITGQFGINPDTAVVWKNFIQYTYSTPGHMSALAFSGTDSFFVGSAGFDAAYWAVDSLHRLIPGFAFANSIALHGSDVFIGGARRDQNNFTQAGYWKNDSMIVLTSDGQASHVNGVVFAANDFYAVGYIAGGNPGPVYWKNDTIHKLGTTGVVNAVCVAK